MWIARDKDGDLYIFTLRPSKRERFWINPKSEFIELPSCLFPEVKWEDKEPRELVLKPIKEEQP